MGHNSSRIKKYRIGQLGKASFNLVLFGNACNSIHLSLSATILNSSNDPTTNINLLDTLEKIFAL